MKEVKGFFCEELGRVEQEICRLSDRLRSLAYDLESIDQACRRMVHNEDSTSKVFLSTDSFQGFEGEELKRLKKQKKELIEMQSQFDLELKEAKQRYGRLKSLMAVCDEKDFNTKDRYDGLKLQEEDRQRIAMDIHDTVIQNLTALILKNQFVLQVLNTDQHRAAIELKKINEVLKSSIDELRDIIFNLRPMSLDDLGFEDTFYNLMNKISKRAELDLQYDYRAGIFEADPVVMINILRIIQELCNNSIKHSNGNHIFVRVLRQGDQVVICEQDDGQGFDYLKQKQSADNGFGLSMIRDRIVLFGGTMKVERRPEGGMRFQISIPIKRRG